MRVFHKDRKPYTAERAYWFSVVPLAILLIANGTLAAILATLPWSQIWIPFIESYPVKRLILGGLGVCHIVFSIGLIRRCRWAWFAFLAYTILGVAWTAAGLILSPPEIDRGPAISFAVAGLLLGGALVVGLYFATKPAFRPAVERPPDES